MKTSEIEQLLPGIFQRTLQPGRPLAALLELMESLHAPAEGVLDRLDEAFDPRRAADRFVPMLARWTNLERLFEQRLRGKEVAPHQVMPTGLGRLRELIAGASYLSQWRGTRKGLLLFLEIATGIEGFDIDEHVLDADGLPRAFHLRVSAPAAADPYRDLIREIIESEKPAYVTYELVIEANVMVREEPTDE